MLNKVMLIGNLGADPDVRKTKNGNSAVTMSIATSEKWKDQDGNPHSKTEWHRVVLYGNIADIAGNYLTKGSKVYIEGKLTTRKWVDKDGKDQYTTEVVVQGYGGTLTMLGNKDDKAGQENVQPSPAPQGFEQPATNHELNDDIPF